MDYVQEMAKLLPAKSDLDEWQQIQYDYMLWMMQQQVDRGGTYKWVAGHDGCFLDHRYRRQHFLKAHKGANPWTYCCGVTLEHFYMSWQKLLGGKFNSELNMDPNFIWQLRAHFFVYRDPGENRYDRGAPGGLEELGIHLDNKDEGGCNEFAEFYYHDDPEEASFGDYIQIQNKADIHSKGGGHAAIFVDLIEEGGKPAVLVFNSNIVNDYGFQPGIGMGWYRVGKRHKDTGYERKFHFGSVTI